MLDTGKYARVELVPAAAEIIAASVGATTTMPIKGPGLTQEDAVQLVSKWAWMRDRFMRGAAGDVKVALYDTAPGRVGFSGVFEGSTEKLSALLKDRPQMKASLVVGDGPLAAPVPGGPGLPDDWGIQLARALDATTLKIAKAEQTGSLPMGPGSLTKLAAAPAVVGIIVGGAAIAVIGSVAVWRYFDPELRGMVSGLQAAADAYDKRIQVMKATGKMPPPTPTEVSMAEQIKGQSDKEKARSLYWALGIGGGLTLAAVGVSFVRGR